MQIGSDGIALIKRFEGCAKALGNGSFDAYPDPGTGGDPWTIGWGSTGPDIHKGLVWTQAQCDARLEADLQHFSAKVAAMVPSATQHQFDALTSFAYNLGPGNLASSTLLKKHKAGDFAGAANEFLRWNRAAGRVLPGLTKRRAAERLLYLGEAA